MCVCELCRSHFQEKISNDNMGFQAFVLSAVLFVPKRRDPMVLGDPGLIRGTAPHSAISGLMDISRFMLERNIHRTATPWSTA